MSSESEKFRKYAHQFVDWMADYMDNVEQYPVKSQVAPREIYHQIESRIPDEGERIEDIFEDFRKIIIPGITHWQSPNFFAYFQALWNLTIYFAVSKERAQEPLGICSRTIFSSRSAHR